ncbi:hypothetical protein DL771_011424 [Monosporascus sp. 5C6A]|nr:hypothetical protein DL771_011424 [Monosporascus sp. 5C6A]
MEGKAFHVAVMPQLRQRRGALFPQKPRNAYRSPDAHAPYFLTSIFEIAIVCALPLEYDAVTLLIDEFWDENGDVYQRAVGDRNAYTIGRNNVVVSREFAAESPESEPSTKFLLGDVIISETIVQHDFGRRYPNGFMTKATIQDSFGRSNADIRGLLAILRSELGLERLQQRTSFFLQTVQSEAARRNRLCRYQYPGTHADKLFAPDYCHKHYGSCQCICSQWKKLIDPVCEDATTSPCTATGCSADHLLPRRRLQMRRTLELQGSHTNIQEPLIFVGPVASGDTVMKSGEDRDRIAKDQKVIAFEMEGSGVWDELSCLVIKGVCDYADSHKEKSWQNFAAATAAATMKALLERYIRTDMPRQETSHDLTTLTLPTRPYYSLDRHWRDTLVQAALKYLPETLRRILVTASYSKPLGIDWGSSITKFIRERPNTPTWLSRTAPYQRFVSSTERTIWYQVASSGAEDWESIQIEYEEIPLSFLRDLENFKKKRGEEPDAEKRQERIVRGEDLGKPIASRPEDPKSSDPGEPMKRDINSGILAKQRRLYLFLCCF